MVHVPFETRGTEIKNNGCPFAISIGQK